MREQRENDTPETECSARATTLFLCPRCKQRCLDRADYGESAIFNSHHRLCVSCFHAEDAEIQREETNYLPETLKAYGPMNDYD